MLEGLVGPLRRSDTRHHGRAAARNPLHPPQPHEHARTQAASARPPSPRLPLMCSPACLQVVALRAELRRGAESLANNETTALARLDARLAVRPWPPWRLAAPARQHALCRSMRTADRRPTGVVLAARGVHAACGVFNPHGFRDLHGPRGPYLVRHRLWRARCRAWRWLRARACAGCPCRSARRWRTRRPACRPACATRWRGEGGAAGGRTVRGRTATRRNTGRLLARARHVRGRDMPVP
jgi:hypothetical protein